jgi:hypothetical protein
MKVETHLIERITAIQSELDTLKLNLETLCKTKKTPEPVVSNWLFRYSACVCFIHL